MSLVESFGSKDNEQFLSATPLTIIMMLCDSQAVLYCKCCWWLFVLFGGYKIVSNNIGDSFPVKQQDVINCYKPDINICSGQ